MRVAFRHGLAALARPGAGTLPAVTALGLGVLAVVAIVLVDGGLSRRLRADLPTDAPNIFLVDMQSSQWPKVRSILDAAGATEVRGVPIVNARLASIDGVAVAELAKKARDEGRRNWILTREQNLTYLDELPKDNVIVEGKLWSDPEHPEISIEQDFAADMGVHIGSKVVYDVQGVPLELTVTSFRTVDWKTFGINFFLVVEPGVLDRSPQMRVAAARLAAGARASAPRPPRRGRPQRHHAEGARDRREGRDDSRAPRRRDPHSRRLRDHRRHRDPRRRRRRHRFTSRARGRAAEDVGRDPPQRRRDLRRRVRVDRSRWRG